MVIKVYVVKINGQLRFRWQHPDTGKWKTKKSTFSRRRDAERAADELSKELVEEYHRRSVDSWDDLVLTYAKLLEKKSRGYQGQFNSAVLAIEELTDIESAKEIDQRWINKMSSKLQDKYTSVSSAASYLKCIRAFIRWGMRNRYLPQTLIVPIPSIPDNSATRGEPIGEEEFKKIIKATVLKVEGNRTRGFEDFLWGLWFTGFRISELFRLRPDDTFGGADPFLMLNAEPAIIVFPTKSQKSKDAELWAMPPDLIYHLKQLPDNGDWVYAPQAVDEIRYGSPSSVGKIISTISERAGVSVEASGKRRWAGAHDIRRSFTHRWLELTGDIELVSRLARHKTSEVTRRFYLRQSVARLSERLAKIQGE